MPVVVQPHEAHWLEHHERGEHGTNQGDEAVKDGNTGADQVPDKRDAASAAQPRSPMDRSVRCQVLGRAHEAHEETLRGQLYGLDLVSITLATRLLMELT